MYEAYFGLNERPFSITPDPRYLFLGRGHRDALAHLLFSIEQDGGFVLLSGEVGTGKTTLSRAVLEQIPDDVEVALILNPRLTAAELVASICDELGVGYPPGCDSLKTLVDRLNAHLLEAHAAGRRTMVVLDEAQNLSIEVLEQVRLLTNLETATEKLLRMVLIGQSEINELLGRRELRQLSQRVTARYHLDGLDRAETAAYVRHRLSVAGTTQPLFTRRALDRLHRLTGGTPRLLNVLCDRALLGAYAHNRRQANRAVVDQAAKEVGGLHRPVPRLLAAGVVASAAALLAALWLWWPGGAIGPAAPAAGPVTASDAATAAAGRGPAGAPLGDLVAAQGQPGPPAGAAGSVAGGPLPDDSLAAGSTAPAGADPAGAPVSAAAGVAPGAAETTAATATPGPPVAPAAPQPIEPPDIDSWLRSAPASLDRDTPLRTLLGLWGQPAGDGPPCDAADDAGLRCLGADGDWRRLANLGLAAVLPLRAGDRQVHYALLTRLDDERATLRIADQSYEYWLNELEPLWNGRFFTLWRPPPEVQRSLFPGNRGSDVAWVHWALNRIDRVDPADDPIPDLDHLGTALQSRIKAFQLAHGLAADGIVGEKTLIHLSAALPGDGQPLLRPAAGGDLAGP